MSTDYGPYCLDCENGFIIDNERCPENVSDLIAFFRALGDAKLPDGYEVKGGYGSSYVDTSWFAKHHGHEVVVHDEYGGRHPDCFAESACPCCDAPFRCKLQKDHEGAHSRTLVRRPTSASTTKGEP